MDELTHITIHHLKIKEQYVPMILDKSMTYQVRDGDRGFQNGHQIRFHVVDVDGHELDRDHNLIPLGDAFTYCTKDEIKSIESHLYEIRGVMTFPWLKDGYVAFSIAPARGSTAIR